MAPRKSISSTTRSVVAAPKQVVASGSKTLPPTSLQETITPAFKRQKLERRILSEDERGALVHELIGFYPRLLCDAIMEQARQSVYDTVGMIEAWAQGKTRRLGDEYRLELDIGLHSLETLLESHVDKAFDKFTAWALRNPFDVPADGEFVLPWHRDLDFERGQHIAAAPGGEDAIMSELDMLRRKVEQSRYLSQQLERAEKVLDRRLEIAQQRKAEVGFISEAISNANLNPLTAKSEAYSQSLVSLHNILSTMEDPHPSLPPTLAGKGANPQSLKAWELGRQAYLSWAVGKAVAQYQDQAGNAGTAGTDEMEAVEQDKEAMGGLEGLEGIMKAAGSAR